MRVTIGLALVVVAVPAVRVWAGAVNVPAEREAVLRLCQVGGERCQVDGTCANQSACLPLQLIAQPVIADLVLSVDDDPTCDTDPQVVCGDPIDGCTTNAGSGNKATVEIRGREHPGAKLLPKIKLNGGQKFTLALPMLQACDIPLNDYTTEGDFPNAGNVQRLTETSLVPIRARDLLFQPLPAAVAQPLLQQLGLSAGIPVITNTGLVTIERHDGSDPLPSILRAQVEISIVR